MSVLSVILCLFTYVYPLCILPRDQKRELVYMELEIKISAPYVQRIKSTSSAGTVSTFNYRTMSQDPV